MLMLIFYNFFHRCLGTLAKVLPTSCNIYGAGFWKMRSRDLLYYTCNTTLFFTSYENLKKEVLPTNNTCLQVTLACKSGSAPKKITVFEVSTRFIYGIGYTPTIHVDSQTGRQNS